VTADDAPDAAPSLTAFLAFTVNLYATPLVRSYTTQLVNVVVHVRVTPPTCGEADTVYLVMTDPPLLTGAVHDTVT
jgi:hypothetical protein